MLPEMSGYQTGNGFPLNTNNRNNNRRRGRGNNRGQGGGGGNQGNRIDSRARGNAPQMLEKYRKLAHDASLNGDRVQTEYYLQFADHYFRVLADSRAMKEEQQQRGRQNDREQQGDDFFDDEDDFDARNRPYETRRERARQQQEDLSDEGQRATESQEGGEDDSAENPFLRDERPRRARAPRRDGNRERAPRDEQVAESEGGFDAGILPPSIVRDEDDAAPKRTLRPRKPRKSADSGDAETLEAVG